MHDEVETAECLVDLGEDRLDVGVVGHVAGQHQRPRIEPCDSSFTWSSKRPDR
jgi:hypothetical protein